MNWQQISVVSDEQWSETVADAFSEQGAQSITFQATAGHTVYEPPPDTHPRWRQTRVVALFDRSADLSDIREAVAEICGPIQLSEWDIEILPDKAWEREWMDHFKAMQFGERLWICPSHMEPPDPQAINLRLDPGLAFGTGTHPTTALCLEWLAVNELQDMVVMDYGCGSGILAVAALLLGARRSIAVDIDSQALLATSDNAANNGVSGWIRCFLPEHVAGMSADIVLANILAKPLQEMASGLQNHVNPGGRLVLSGILEEQVEPVIAAYSQIFSFSEPVIRENWARLDGIKRL